MGAIKQPKDSLLFFGIMYSDERLAKKALAILIERYGEVAEESDEFDFYFTKFYQDEFGDGLKKRFVLFGKPIARGELSEMKVFGNEVEGTFAKDGKRMINLDPGYVTEHNVVLASCKEFPHRVYIGNGIYAEVEMMFKKDGVEYPAYAYSDYKTELAKKFFLDARKRILD